MIDVMTYRRYLSCNSFIKFVKKNCIKTLLLFFKFLYKIHISPRRIEELKIQVGHLYYNVPHFYKNFKRVGMKDLIL